MNVSARKPADRRGIASSSPNNPKNGMTKKDLEAKFPKPSGKMFNDKELDSYMLNASYTPLQKDLVAQIFLEKLIQVNTSCQKQMSVHLRDLIRKSKISAKGCINWARDFSGRLEDWVDDLDVPKAAEYFGRVISIFATMKMVAVPDVVQKFSPKTKNKETHNNLYMTGFIKGCMESDAEELLISHREILQKGFRFAPKEYNKLAKRAQIPKQKDLPILTQILGEGYEAKIQESQAKRR